VAVASRAEILLSWHMACGSTVFADGGATSDRYLIALAGGLLRTRTEPTLSLPSCAARMYKHFT